MSGSVNLVILVGNVGQDPEMRYLQSGTAVTNFSLATNRRWRANDGALAEETTWHRIVAWAKLAEQCNEYLSKGRKVHIQGRLSTRTYQAQDGSQRTVTEVIAERMVMLDSRRDAPGNGQTTGDDETYDVDENDVPIEAPATAPAPSPRTAPPAQPRPAQPSRPTQRSAAPASASRR